MFDAIPVHVWLVAVIAATAFRPAQYVYLYIVHSPSRRDITQPPEDLSWRTPGELAYHGAILVLLLAVAVFIFTPTAERLARSERFLPLLAALFGSWAAFTAVRGFTTGRIQPLMRGIAKTYRRRKHPIRYWASVAWNAALGCSLMWLAYGINEDATAQEFADRCAQRAEGELVLRQLAACDELVRLRPDDAESYLDRGVIFLELGGLDSAIADFNRAHQLDPEDPWPLANRGVRSGVEKGSSRC